MDEQRQKRLVNILNRRDPEGRYIVAVQAGEHGSAWIVRTSTKQLISTLHAALRALEAMGDADLLEEMKTKCELDDNVKEDLKEIWATLWSFYREDK